MQGTFRREVQFRPRGTLRRGTILIYCAVILPLMLGICSLAVDLGRVLLTKTELQRVADASARSAAAAMKTSVSAAEDAAVYLAAINTADNAAVTLVRGTDVEFGTWNSSSATFTLLTGSARSSANAIRVTARRASSRSSAVPLAFGQVIGFSTMDVQGVAIAQVGTPGTGGITGLNSIDMKNNNYIGGYDSGANPNPSQATASTYGGLGTNGAINGGNNNVLDGDVILGPGASTPTGVAIHGSQKHLTAAIPAPTQASWSPGTNPGGLSQNYSASGNVTLPAGTYWFTSLTVSGSLTFSGPTTINVNGSVNLSGELAGYNNLPKNLVIKQIGSNTFGNAGANGAVLIADVEGPASDFVMKNNFRFQGRMLFKTIDVKNNAEFYYDTTLGSVNGGNLSIVK